MRKPILMLVGAAVVAAGACATIPIIEPTEWNATIMGYDVAPEVRASARAVSGPVNTTVAIDLAGGTPGADYPWHIHEGTCATGGPIVGDATAYPRLRPGSTGRAAATAVVAPVLIPGQEYHVNVHRSPAELQTILACGNLR